MDISTAERAKMLLNTIHDLERLKALLQNNNVTLVLKCNPEISFAYNEREYTQELLVSAIKEKIDYCKGELESL